MEIVTTIYVDGKAVDVCFEYEQEEFPESWNDRDIEIAKGQG